MSWADRAFGNKNYNRLLHCEELLDDALDPNRARDGNKVDEAEAMALLREALAEYRKLSYEHLWEYVSREIVRKFQGTSRAEYLDRSLHPSHQ